MTIKSNITIREYLNIDLTCNVTLTSDQWCELFNSIHPFDKEEFMTIIENYDEYGYDHVEIEDNFICLVNYPFELDTNVISTKKCYKTKFKLS